MRLGVNETAVETAPLPRRAARVASCIWLCAALLPAVVLPAGCGSSQSGGEEAPAQTAAAPTPAVPAEYTAGAKNYLGPSAEVLVFGDLALNGGNQILVADPMPGVQESSSQEITVVRAVILDKQGDTWKEIFRCDEHLTNQNGFLAGTPTSPVTGWRMEYEQDSAKGLELKFAEASSSANHSATYVVRWNPKVKRYECLDKKGERFLGELPVLGEPASRDLLK